MNLSTTSIKWSTISFNCVFTIISRLLFSPSKHFLVNSLLLHPSAHPRIYLSFLTFTALFLQCLWTWSFFTFFWTLCSLINGLVCLSLLHCKVKWLYCMSSSTSFMDRGMNKRCPNISSFVEPIPCSLPGFHAF